jgi:hypothetical protein
MTINYILAIEPENYYDTNLLKKQLDSYVDWLQIVPNVFFIVSSSELETCQRSFEPILNGNKYFIAELNIKNCFNYQGYLSRAKWDWIKTKEQKALEKLGK